MMSWRSLSLMPTGAVPPMPEPARKAMVSPLCRLWRAASAVRTLAFTETFMPTKPVTPESTAPMMKPIAEVTPRK